MLTSKSMRFWGILLNSLCWSTMKTSAAVAGYQRLLQSQSIPEATLLSSLAYRSISDSSIYTDLNVTSINNLTDFAHKYKCILAFPLCSTSVDLSLTAGKFTSWDSGHMTVEQTFPELCSTSKDFPHPLEKKPNDLRSPGGVAWWKSKRFKWKRLINTFKSTINWEMLKF